MSAFSRFSSPQTLSALEMFPLTTRDLTWVTALETAAQRFPWREKHFADSLAAGDEGWGARRSGAPLGFVWLMLAGEESHLLNLAVSVAARRQGVGARLLAHALSRARRAGCGQMYLEVRPSNADALLLYRQFSFQQVGVRKAYYPAGTDAESGRSLREDALIFCASILPESASI
jgi:ribosomal-protein-alanine acetyltransferase